MNTPTKSLTIPITFNVPDGLQWICQDADGSWYATDIEPDDPHPTNPNGWDMANCGEGYFLCTAAPNPDWRNTKQFIGGW